MVLFRRLLGDVLRRHRQRQSRTLRDVAAAARISLGYLSEIERGRKEASSELLASLCEALGVSLADILREVSADLSRLEHGAIGAVGFGRREVASVPPAPALPRAVASLNRVPVTTPAAPAEPAVPVASAVPVAHLGVLRAADRPVAAA